MYHTFRAFKYSSTNKYIINKSNRYNINSQNSISNEIIWYHFFAEKNRTLQIILTTNLEVKLEIENINCTLMYLIDYINFKEIKNFSTNINENVLFVSFICKIEKKFQVTFYSNSEANIFNEMINKIIFGVNNPINNIYSNFITKLFQITKSNKEFEKLRCKKYVNKKLKYKILQFINKMNQITDKNYSN